MEIKTFSTYIDFEYDDLITGGMVKQLEFYILESPYIDGILSCYILQNRCTFEKHTLEITVAHHTKDDEIISKILNRLLEDFVNNIYLFTKPRGMRC